MKRIIFFIRDISKSGGTERVLIDIANGLAVRGYEIHIVTLFKEDDTFYNVDKRIDIIKMYDCVIDLKKISLCAISPLRIIINNLKPDVFVTVDTTFSIITVPALFGLNVKKIAWEHFNFDMPKNIFGKIAKYIALFFSHKIVVLTDGDKFLWESKWWSKNKIIKINNPCNLNKTKNIPGYHNKTVLAVGRLVHQKGFDMLIKSWLAVKKVLPDWKLVIVGNGDDKCKLQELIKELSLEQQVTIKGGTKNIASVYQNASLYCLSSRYEGWGLVLVEAQQFNLPIVSFDCKFGPREIIKDGYNGFLVEENRIDQLSQCIINICSDEKYYNKIVINTLNTDTAPYDINNVISKWESVIQEK